MRMLKAVLLSLALCGYVFAADEVNLQLNLTVDSSTTGFRDQRNINQNFSITNLQVQTDMDAIQLLAGTTTKVSSAAFVQGWSMWRNTTSNSVIRLCTSLNAGTNLADFSWMQWKSTSIMELATNASIVLYAVPVQLNDMTKGTNAVLEKRIYSK